MKYALTIGMIILFLPIYARAQVQVTEVAWMGTAESQFGEWIEFYNPADSDINMSGWKLYEGGGETLVFTFTKSISGKGYLVLERTTASSPDPLSQVNDEAGTFGGSGLSNSGESLVLKDASGTTIATLPFSGGWPAGDSESKQTMQWDGTKWITAAATPKAPTAGGVPSGESPTSTPSGGGSTWQPVRTEPRIVLSVPTTIFSGVSYEYNATAYLDYGQAYSGGFVWNMGDGTVYRSVRPDPIVHSYEYPGKYTITFGFFRNSYDKKPFLMQSVERTVEHVGLSVSIAAGKGLVFKNTTKEPFDLSGWIVATESQEGVLPPLSFIAPVTTVVIPFARLGILEPKTITLLTPERVALSGQEKKTERVSVVSSQQKQESSTVGVRPSQTLFQTAQANALTAQAESIFSDTSSEQRQQRHPKTIFFGVALLLVIGLFLLLERTMAKGE